MYNFNAVVDSVILEAQQNQKLEAAITTPPFLGLFDAYKNAYGIDLAAAPNLEAALNLVVSSGQRIPARDVLAQAIPVIDAFEQVHTYLVGLPNSQLKTKTTLDDLLDAITSAQGQDKQKINDLVDGVTKKIQTAQTNEPLDYFPTAPKTQAAHRTITAEFDKLSQTAVEQLGRDTIQNALQKIITKRTSVADRILGGKGLRKPFQSTLLIPLFDYYKKYTTGGSILYDKIPGDFKDSVDQLSIDKVINVAILSGEYYLSLLRRVMGQQQQQTQQPQQQQTQPRPGVLPPTAPPPPAGAQQQTAAAPGPAAPFRGRVGTYDSLISFDAYVKDLLSEAPPPNPNQQQRGLTKDVYDGTARSIGNARLSDFVLFVKEGKSMWMPETQKQGSGIIYNLDTISKDTSKEAQALYGAIRNMAYYTRETSGFGYRSKQLGKAASSLASFGGAKLYGN